jgi:PAS domain S-box-containing protein
MKKTDADAAFDVARAAGVLPSVLDALDIGLAVVSATGRILLANQALRRFLGYADKPLAGVNRRSVTFPEDAEISGAAYRQVLAGRRQVTSFEKRYVRADGRVVWGRLALAAVPEAAGQPTYVVAACQDITRARELEARLQTVADLLGEFAPAPLASLAQEERLSARLSGLTKREAEIVRLLAANRRVGSIARTLGLTPRTVRNHLVSAYRKLGVHSQAALIDLLNADERAKAPSEPAPQAAEHS